MGWSSRLHREKSEGFDSPTLHHNERRIVKKLFYLFILIIILSFIPTIPIEIEVNDSVTTIEYKSVAEWAWEIYNTKAILN